MHGARPEGRPGEGTDVASTSKSKNGFSVTVYQGDFKTLLAFNLASKAGAKNLAGFTVQTQPKGKTVYFLFNSYPFETPARTTRR